VAALIRARECIFGLGLSVLGKQKHPQLEPTFGDAPLVGSAVGLLSTANVAAIREQRAEVERSGSMTARIRTRKPLLGLGQLVRFDESQAEVERRFGGSGLRCRQGVSQGAKSIV
jgi:hypothetical protein